MCYFSSSFLFQRYFNGTHRAKELLVQGNYTYFNLLTADIKDPKHSPNNYFMEACEYWSNRNN